MATMENCIGAQRVGLNTYVVASESVILVTSNTSGDTVDAWDEAEFWVRGSHETSLTLAIPSGLDGKNPRQ